MSRPWKPSAKPPYHIRIKNGTEEANWDALAKSMPIEMNRCWDHLANNPTMGLPNGRCHELKGQLRGTYQYKPSTGHRIRIWFRVDEKQRIVYIDAVYLEHPAATARS